jgi:hypothetical protein
MHVRTILHVLSKVQGLFDLRRIRKATILYRGRTEPQDNALKMMGNELSNIRRMRALKS